MRTEIKHYTELSKDEFHDMIALRISVFVVEQDCPYQELDGKDRDAYHVLIKEDDQIIGTARILKPGVAYTETSIGRVVSAIGKRHLKLGHALMTATMNFILSEMNEKSVRLSAQTHLKNFYVKYGFVATGKDYLEDGIPHSEMLFNA
jgi:ElaA protein